MGSHAVRRGGLFLEGHYLRDGTTAYGPWIEALRSGLHQSTRDEIARWVGGYASDVAQAVPDLVEQLGLLPPPPALAPDEQRRRLFEGIAGLLTGLSRKAPLVLLLDDLQWAPGLSLLLHVARRLGEARALIIGTYRDREFKDQPALVREWSEFNWWFP